MITLARALSWALLLAIAVFVGSRDHFQLPAHGAAGGKQPPAARITDMAWLAGHWQGKTGNSFIEEVWSPAAGNGMIGMFRIVKNDKMILCELCMIQEEEMGLILRLRHFNHLLDAKEDKDKALVWSVAKIDKNQAVFQLREGKLNEVLTYQRDDAQTLSIILDKEKDGKKTRQVFSFKRYSPKS